MTFSMHWPIQSGHITQKFGENPHIYNKFNLPGHEGIDWGAPIGTELYAVADGFISDVRLDGNVSPTSKPYGNQVRIQHDDGFTSVYAHLSEAVVTRGQFVKRGQLIGLVGNTGNSTGPHLHLTLKKQGSTQSKETNYPHDIVDPTPYLDHSTKDDGGTQPQPPAEPSIQVQVESPEAGYLNIRNAPHTGGALVTQADHGSQLGALEEEAVTRAKIGKAGQWLWVKTADGKIGHTAAWYLKLPASAPQPTDPDIAKSIFAIVESPEVPLKLRSGPGTAHSIVATMPDGTSIKILESESAARSKIGKHGQWIEVQTPGGQKGHTAAWYLKLQTAQPTIPDLKPNAGKATKYVVVESPEFGLKVRQGPSSSSKQVWWVPHGTALESLESPVVTGRKITQQGEWIKVRTPALWEGYVAAWYVRYPKVEDNRQPADEYEVAKCISPHIFGIHAVTLGDDPHTKDPIRGLYHGKNKSGWVFFTEQCGRHAQNIGPNDEIRNRLWEWAEQGYGVIVRLNHGYEPGGTLPESRYYDDFAAAAARWAECFLKRPELADADYAWTIQIANEQNNPREHPGGFEHPSEHITPERYAEAFNKTYAKIKQVLPNSIICTGAVDPYNYMPWKLMGSNPPYRPLDYYEKMLANIDALDGIILHAYVHGPDIKSVTHLARFGNGSGPLHDHYFDFQIYRLFMERVPFKWRDQPVYITEMNHICRPPAAPTCSDPHAMGWVRENSGVVREIYKEINRWNNSPYMQQIRCGLLYRWMGDAWSINDKPGVLDDFKQSLDNDYRWRTKPAGSGDFSFAIPITEVVEEPLEERGLRRPDNLKRIWGIGRKSQLILNIAGIFTFEVLAALSLAQLREIIGESGLRARHEETWAEQAQLAVLGQWDALKAYKEKL